MRSASAALVPAARFLAKLLWIFAKGVVAVAVWAVCMTLVWFAWDWLCKATGFEGIAGDIVGELLFFGWFAVAINLALRLHCWVDGDRWHALYNGPPAYQRPDYAPGSPKT